MQNEISYFILDSESKNETKESINKDLINVNITNDNTPYSTSVIKKVEVSFKVISCNSKNKNYDNISKPNSIKNSNKSNHGINCKNSLSTNNSNKNLIFQNITNSNSKIKFNSLNNLNNNSSKNSKINLLNNKRELSNKNLVSNNIINKQHTSNNKEKNLSQNNIKYTDNIIESEGNYSNGRWLREEHKRFVHAILKHGNEWKLVQKCVLTRSSTQSRSHAQKFFLKIKRSNFLQKYNLDKSINIQALLNLTKSLPEEEYNELLNTLYEVPFEKGKIEENLEKNNNENSENSKKDNSSIKSINNNIKKNGEK